MDISTDKSGQETVLTLAGELTIYAVQEVHQHLVSILPEIREGIRLDLGGVTEADTAGIQLLLGFRKEIHGRGLTFTMGDNCEAIHSAGNTCGVYDLLS